MIKWFQKSLKQWYQLPPIRNWYQTMIVLYPLSLFGTYFNILAKAWWSPNGYLYQVTNAQQWLSPQWSEHLGQLTNWLSQMLSGGIGVLGGVISAYFWARYFQRDVWLMVGGMTLISVGGLCQFKPTGAALQWPLAGLPYLLMWLLLAWGVSWLLARFGRIEDEATNYHEQIQQRVQASFWPLGIGIVVMLGFHLVIDTLSTIGGFEWWQAWLQNLLTESRHWGNDLGLVVLYAGLQWLGLADANNCLLMPNNQQWQANLVATLTHQSLPYPLTSAGIYNAYVALGGSGAWLALLIAISLVTPRIATQRILKWNLIPVLFNQPAPLMLGLPILFNPLWLGGMIVVSLMNFMITSGLIMLGWLATPVFTTPDLTPTILNTLIMTNGDWRSWLVVVGLLILDVGLYLPLVRYAQSLGTSVELKVGK